MKILIVHYQSLKKRLDSKSEEVITEKVTSIPKFINEVPETIEEEDSLASTKADTYYEEDVAIENQGNYGDFILETHSYQSDEFAEYIVGTVLNNSDISYSAAELEISLFDEAGNLVGNAYDSINDLAAGQTWKFEAMYIEENIYRYEITRITGH